MTEREFFIYTMEDELPRFERLLKALPKEKWDYRPHEKSRSAAEIVNAMARESSTFGLVLKEGRVDARDFGMMPAKMDTAADIDSFLDHMKRSKEIAASLTETTWDSNARMTVEDKVEWEVSRGKMAWGFLLDLIHHRGQLSVYIRPMGGKVPSVYGPSGDAQE